MNKNRFYFKSINIFSLVFSVLPISPTNADFSQPNFNVALPNSQYTPETNSSPILVEESRAPAIKALSIVEPFEIGPRKSSSEYSVSTTRVIVNLSTRVVRNLDVRLKLDEVQLSRAKAEFTAEGQRLSQTYGSPVVSTVSNFLTRTGSALQVWEYSSPGAAQENLAKIRTNPYVLKAFPDRILEVQKTPNDKFYSNIWGMNAIRAPEAWDKKTGDKAVTVAVIDTGIELQHPDLVSNLWSNPGEIAGNGLDDDGNGLVDDIHGWDYVDNDGNPNDDLIGWAGGHGTHVAGTIGAKGNNSIGVAGVNWNVSLMALRICGQYGCYLSDFWKAITYAYNEGAQVANASFGGPYSPFAEEQDVIASVAEPGVGSQKGVLLVAAAGNYGANNDTQNFCPACYQLPNVVSVAATRDGDSLAGFSNYGKQKVTIAAPGESIFSTIPRGAFKINDNYGYLSGTSMAAPQVSGGAALFFSQSPSWRPSEVKNALIKSTRRVSSLSSKVLTGGIMDVNALLSVTSPPNPFMYVDLLGTGKGSVSINGYLCESNCFAEIAKGQIITLTAQPAPGKTFQKWSGSCDGSTSLTCSIVQTDSPTFAKAWFSGTPDVSQIQSQIRAKEELPIRTESTGYWPWDNSLSMAVSGNGTTMAYGVMRWPTEGFCNWTETDMGGVAAVNLNSGNVEKVWRAPYWPGSSARDRIWNCLDFGNNVSISEDGRTLVTSLGWDYKIDFENQANDWFRCGVVVYRKMDSGLWNEGTVVAPSELKNCFHTLERTSTSFSAYINWYNPSLSSDGNKLFVRGVNQVHVFELNGGEATGYQNLKLPSECITTTKEAFQGFASHIKPFSSGEGLLIGTSACKDSTEAYLYKFTNNSWTVSNKFSQISDLTWSSGVAVSADGGFIAISYSGKFGSGINLYSIVNGQWKFLRDLNGIKPYFNQTSCDFVASGKKRIVCTNPYLDIGYNIRQGAVIVYDSPTLNWTQGVSTQTLWNELGTPNEGAILAWANSQGTKIKTSFGATTIGSLDYDFYAMGTNFDFGEVANTAAPTISGSAAVNQILTATSGTWSGSPVPKYTYQWFACTNDSSTETNVCAEISGAKSATYKLTLAQKGLYIRVRVTATNTIAAANAFSSATAAVGAAPSATGTLTVSGTASVGAVLTMNNGLTWSGFPQPDEATQWHRCNSRVSSLSTTIPASCTQISGATSSTYTLTSDDSGKFISVARSATSSAGSGLRLSASTATAIGQAPTNSAAPTISGSAAVNQILTATSGTWSGSPVPKYTYQWFACTNDSSTETNVCAEISGAKSATYKLTLAQKGLYIRVRVTATNTIAAANAFSSATAAVGAAPSATGTLTVSGTASVGAVLTMNNGLTWSGFPQPDEATQWHRCNSRVSSLSTTIPASCTQISGATSSTYTLTSDDSGKFISVARSATSSAGSGLRLSASTATAIGQAPTNSAAPTISGSAAVNQILTATSGTWSGSPVPKYTYQWFACTNDSSTETNVCAEISGAKSATYKLTLAQKGLYIRVRVTATNTIAAANAFSSATAAVGT